MLDLQPIKARVEAATSWSINGDGGEFQRKATGDVYDLVAEVERLRGELHQAHREVLSDERVADDFYRSNSLNLASIKKTLAVVSEWCAAKDDDERWRCCVSNVANNLMAEVERLRGAIDKHRKTTALRLGGSSPWATDIELWEVLK